VDILAETKSAGKVLSLTTSSGKSSGIPADCLAQENRQENRQFLVVTYKMLKCKDKLCYLITKILTLHTMKLMVHEIEK